MTLKPEDRERVRQRARFRCEYCEVHENDVGAVLTVDPFQPKTRGGGDDLENLIYCCISCNQHKHDYWAKSCKDPKLLDPRRRESADSHLLELQDGTLQALTPTGEFSIRRLRLNRQPLIAYRLRRRRETRKDRLLQRFGALNDVTERLLEQQSELIESLHQELLEQQNLMQRLLDDSSQ